MVSLNPVDFTKESQLAGIEQIVNNARHIRLDMERLRAVAERITGSIESNWIDAYRDADEHYRAPVDLGLGDLDRVQYQFVFGTLGWLIWEWAPEDEKSPDPDPWLDRSSTDRRAQPIDAVIDGVHYVGSFSMSAFHARWARQWKAGQAKNWLDPHVLASLTLEDVEAHYTDDNGKLSVQMLDRRLENLQEVGRVLLSDFDGHFINLLRRADGYLFKPDGTGLVQLMQTKFPSSWYDWPVGKLTNVIPLNINESLRLTGEFAAEVAGLLDFKDWAEGIEGGADYYRPQFFIRVGIFDISPEFKQKLRNHELIEPNSDMELEFRAFTLVALRRLAELTGGWPQALKALEIETHAVPFLHCRRCRVGVSDQKLPCAYRDVCKATHDDHELMDTTWPLVMTNHY